jgi:hypothetical protein
MIRACLKNASADVRRFIARSRSAHFSSKSEPRYLGSCGGKLNFQTRLKKNYPGMKWVRILLNLKCVLSYNYFTRDQFGKKS